MRSEVDATGVSGRRAPHQVGASVRLGPRPDRTQPAPESDSAGGVGARAGRLDAAAVLGLVAFAAVLASRLNFAAHPLEDAAMLMRYAANLAHGHGMVWNVGGHPVDGATDFLFTVVLAIPIRLGLAPIVAVRAFVIGAVVLTTLLVYLTARTTQRAARPVAIVAATWIVLGPGLRLAEAGFGAPFFGLTVGGAWAAAWWYRRAPSAPRRAAAFAAACLIMGLVRPEGVLLAGLMVFALLVDLGPARSRVLLGAGLVAAAFGAGYFAWRWNYFGYPLPNPYYKKGGGALHPDGLIASARYAVTFAWPYLLVVSVAFVHRATRRLAVFTLIPFVGFTGLWLLVSDEVNYLGRFQYPLLVLGAMALAPLWTAIRREVIGSRARVRTVVIEAVGAGLVVALVAGGVGIRLDAFDRSVLFTRDGRYDTGRVLAGYAGRGYTLVTTEAGLLPFTSGWRTVDAWGLNDPHIVHHGLSTAYLDRNRPDVIMVHTTYSPIDPHPALEWISGWNHMTAQLGEYARTHRFTYAAAFGTVHDTWNFYVRSTNPDACAITARIRAVRFVPLGSVYPLPDLLGTHPTARCDSSQPS